MTDFEKEKRYQEAVGFLTSSFSNDQLIEESLAVLKELGDYKDAASLYEKHFALHQADLEEKAKRAKRRRVTRVLQTILMVLGLAVLGGLIFLIVYGLRLW